MEAAVSALLLAIISARTNNRIKIKLSFNRRKRRSNIASIWSVRRKITESYTADLSRRHDNYPTASLLLKGWTTPRLFGKLEIRSCFKHDGTLHFQWCLQVIGAVFWQIIILRLYEQSSRKLTRKGSFRVLCTRWLADDKIKLDALVSDSTIWQLVKLTR